MAAGAGPSETQRIGEPSACGQFTPRAPLSRRTQQTIGIRSPGLDDRVRQNPGPGSPRRRVNVGLHRLTARGGSALHFSHWLIVAGAVLIVLGLIGFAFQKKAKSTEENLEQEVAPPEERTQSRHDRTKRLPESGPMNWIALCAGMAIVALIIAVTTDLNMVRCTSGSFYEMIHLCRTAKPGS
jgi:hypothetical protein